MISKLAGGRLSPPEHSWDRWQGELSYPLYILRYLVVAFCNDGCPVVDGRRLE